MSTTGSISFGIALLAGRNRVPRPAAGMTAFRTGSLRDALMGARLMEQRRAAGQAPEASVHTTLAGFRLDP
ncbi:hypothetical protein GCM10027599_26430 [Yimella radicis]